MKQYILYSILLIFSCNPNSNKNVKDPCGGMYLPRRSQIESEHARYLYTTAVEKMQSGYFESALELFNEADEVEPNNPMIIHERGLLKSNWRKFDDAIIDLKLSIELTKDEQSKYIRLENLGLVYLEAGKKDKACECFEDSPCGNSPAYLEKYCK